MFKKFFMAAVLFGAIFSATDVAAATLTKKQAEKVINAFIDDPCEDYFIKKVRSTKAFDEIGYLTWAENYFDKNDFKKCEVKTVEKVEANVYGVAVDLVDEDRVRIGELTAQQRRHRDEQPLPALGVEDRGRYGF